MSDIPRACDFCKTGHLVKRRERIVFRQWTNKGFVFCRVVIPIDLCDRCGSRGWDEATESIIEETFRKEYEQLSAAG
jgi:hypothetical protein